MDVGPGFRVTDLGSIPETWEVLELDTLSPFVTSGSRGWAEYYSEYGAAFIRITNLRRDSIYVDLTDLKRVALPPNGREGARTQLCDRDLLISITADIGIIGFVDSSVPKPAYINQHVALVRLDNSKADTQFLAYFLAGENSQRAFKAATDQGAKAGMNLLGVRRIKVAFPPIGEQRALAVALSDIDALLGVLDRIIAKKRDLKQAAMQQLLTGQTRLPGFRGKWETKRIADLADVDPEQLASNTTPPDYEFKYISLEDVDRGFLRGYAAQIFRSAPSRARRRLRRDDVLVSTVRPNLKSHLWFRETSTDWVCSTGFAVVRCKQGIAHPGFIFAQFFANGINRQIDSLITGSNYPAINSKDVRRLELLAPPFQEQAALAEAVADIDAEIAAWEQRREKTRLIKQGMMQELLTGRTRLV